MKFQADLWKAEVECNDLTVKDGVSFMSLIHKSKMVAYLFYRVRKKPKQAKYIS